MLSREVYFLSIVNMYREVGFQSVVILVFISIQSNIYLTIIEGS